MVDDLAEIASSSGPDCPPDFSIQFRHGFDPLEGYLELIEKLVAEPSGLRGGFPVW